MAFREDAGVLVQFPLKDMEARGFRRDRSVPPVFPDQGR